MSEHLTHEALCARFRDARTIGIHLAQDGPVGAGSTHPARLPNGDPLDNPTACARYVIDLLEQGQVMGFCTDDNPECDHPAILAAEGHDFAVIGGRYIIDLWLRFHAWVQAPAVFDLDNPAHAGPIREIYGTPAAWHPVMLPEHVWPLPARSGKTPSKSVLLAERDRTLSLLALATTALRDLSMGYPADEIGAGDSVGLDALLAELVPYLRARGIDDEGGWDCPAVRQAHPNVNAA